MADEKLESILSDIRAADLTIGSDGRVIIANPELAERLKGMGGLRPDLAARSDTNIICCGNSKCGGHLESLLEQVVSRAGGRLG